MINKNSIQFEKHWREKIADEIKEMIDAGSEINAYGIYLWLKEKAKNVGI